MPSPSEGNARRDQVRRPGRGLILPLAGVLALAVVAALLVVRLGAGEHSSRSAGRTEPVEVTAGGTPSPAAEVAQDVGPVRFDRFPLDRGWAQLYGQGFVDGPDPGAGGISMPEGHCDEEVLFRSGYEAKLSTYVSVGAVSRTREILGYATAGAARSTFRALRDAVARCAAFDDPHSGEVAGIAEVYRSIDGANARRGRTTFTFAYTSPGSDPFGVLYQFAVVDGVLYGSSAYGDWPAARDGVTALAAENGPLISLLSRIQR